MVGLRRGTWILAWIVATCSVTLAEEYNGSGGELGRATSGEDCDPNSVGQPVVAGMTLPLAGEAQAVWAVSKQVLVDQLAEQIKDEERAVMAGAAAVDSVKRCAQSASAASLEAMQQSEIVNLLTKNTKELTTHIDTVEQVANEEMINTDNTLNKAKEKLQNLRNRISKAQQELVAKPLHRLRRRNKPLGVEGPDMPQGPAKRSLGSALGAVSAPKKAVMPVMQNAVDSGLAERAIYASVQKDRGI